MAKPRAKVFGARDDLLRRAVQLVQGRRIQRHAFSQTTAAHSVFRLAGDQHLPAKLGRPGEMYIADEILDFARQRAGAAEMIGIDQDCQHVVGDGPRPMDPRRASWQHAFAHAASRQLRVCREALFRHTDVEQVVAALDGGAPANAADLQALVVQHLEDVAAEIRSGSGDGWKTFWNTEVEKPVKPKAENICRNALLGLLKPCLIRHGAVAKSEGHYAGSKRADIDVTAGTLVLPIEIKLQMHDALWTAADEQLQRLYTADPLAGGRGVYLVFWFGRSLRLMSPPDGLPPPASVDALKTALVNRLSGTARELLSMVVIDAAPPDHAPPHR